MGLLLIPLALLLAACNGAADDNDATTDTDQAAADVNMETWELRFATFFGPNAPYAVVQEWWNNEVSERTDGRVTVETLHGEALLPSVEILPGIADRRADMGYTIEGFHHAELPLSAAASIPFVTGDAYAHALAFHELYQTNEAYRAEFNNAGVHVLYFPMGTPNMLGSVDQLYGSIDELQGENIRAVGYANQALAAIGSNPQAMPGVEIFESLQRGLLDGYLLQFDLVADWGLAEVARYMTDPGHGQYTLPFISINLDLWESLPEDIQQILSDVSDEAMERMLDAMEDAAERSCTAIEEQEGAVSIWSEEEVQRWKTAIGSSIIDDWRSQVDERGLDADAFWTQYQEVLQEKEQASNYVDGFHQCVERMS